MTAARRLYTVLMVLLFAFVVYSTTAAPAWLQTDFSALLPQEERPDVLLQAADNAVAEQADGQVVLLAGSTDAEQAFQTAADIAGLWRQSRVFSAVDSTFAPDLAAAGEEVRRLGLAVLPPQQRQMLFEEPERYFRERAEAAVNPFAAPSALPLSQDWLGFGRFVPDRARPQSRLRWHTENGMLFSEDGAGKTWVWLRGRLPAGGSHAGLPPLLQQSRALAARSGVAVLAAGGAVFAAESKAAAERESRLMGTAGLLFTFALLLWIFRSARVFWLALPLAAGLLAGLAAVLLVFGSVHILTIVIGTSLAGMLVDFPLHWLAPSIFGTAARRGAHSDGLNWQPVSAMRQVLPAFAVSLLITAAGYAFLWLTPLPVLQQTAVFSGFALLGAFGATVWWLPPLFARYRPAGVPFAGWSARLYGAAVRLQNRLGRTGWRVVGAFFLLGGLWRSDWHDDIRQWVNLPQPLLAEAQQAGVLAGFDFGGRYLVVEAGSEDALLRKNAEVGRALHIPAAQQKLAGIQSLDQWLMPVSEQQKLQNRLRELAKLPESWQPLRDLGVPAQAVRQALNSAAAAPAVTLSDGLKPALAEAWRPLYLGEPEPGRFASVIRLNGVSDAAAVQTAVKGMDGVYWADKRSRLNSLFRATRNQAAWLKLASYGLALLLLWRLFGIRRGSMVLAVPLTAAVATVAVLGWAGIPVSLFAMFGLLLVSAVGTDYAVYAAASGHSIPARFGGLLPAALTTGFAFALLGLSSTPAVAAFGITVAAGTLINLWLAVWLLNRSGSA
ncbi:MMPL family transporter [Neisseria leonii]|uniref:MMPL family transporter n=1 Tax=Neisseria leonii TaxID=2995413 RepID=A0A9X4E5L7_9NEIS|nr:MMPL family transporter [Neisseria sp. 51.81]MDD9327857.1 MMPL family transporter [Neisseria sp. 51.81]